jgi:hypothetical protein
VSKSNLTHLRPTSLPHARVAQVTLFHQTANSVYRTRLSQRERPPRELELKAARRLLRGEILYTREEQWVLAKRWRIHFNPVRPNSSPDLQPRGAGRLADRSIARHGKAESNERLQLFHAPDYGGEPYPLPSALR